MTHSVLYDSVGLSFYFNVPNIFYFFFNTAYIFNRHLISILTGDLLKLHGCEKTPTIALFFRIKMDSN